MAQSVMRHFAASVYSKVLIAINAAMPAMK
jgi:hypothetical protein